MLVKKTIDEAVSGSRTFSKHEGILYIGKGVRLSKTSMTQVKIRNVQLVTPNLYLWASWCLNTHFDTHYYDEFAHWWLTCQQNYSWLIECNLLTIFTEIIWGPRAVDSYRFKYSQWLILNLLFAALEFSQPNAFNHRKIVCARFICYI